MGILVHHLAVTSLAKILLERCGSPLQPPFEGQSVKAWPVIHTVSHCEYLPRVRPQGRQMHVPLPSASRESLTRKPRCGAQELAQAGTMRKWNRGDTKRTDPTQAWTLDGLGPCDSLPSLEGTLGEEA